MRGSSTQPAAWAGIALLIALVSGCGPSGGRMVEFSELSSIKVGEQTAKVALLGSFQQQQLGLKYRTAESLGPDEGVLFVYQPPRAAELTMQDVLVELDVAFIDNAGKVLSIQNMKPQSDVLAFKKYKSPSEAAYALQMPAGWFAKAGVTVGTEVPDLPSPRS